MRSSLRVPGSLVWVAVAILFVQLLAPGSPPTANPSPPQHGGAGGLASPRASDGSAAETLGWRSPSPASINETTLKGFSFPFGVTYDPVNGYIYVGNYGSSNVSVIDPSSNRVLAGVPVTVGAHLLVCDTQTGDIFVGGTSAVTVISGRTSSVMSIIQIPNGYPQPATFDSENGFVYATSPGNPLDYVLNRTAVVATVQLPAGISSGAAYDSITKDVYAGWGNYTSNNTPPAVNLSIVNGTTNTIVGRAEAVQPLSQMLYVPSVRSIYAASNWGNLSVVSDVTNQLVSLLHLDGDRYGGNLGGVTYDPRNGNVYVTNRFHDVWFGTGGPYNGEGDNVWVVNATTNTVVQNITVWDSPIGIAYDDRTNELFVANSLSGSVSVINLTSTYDVQFTETGLPSGANWSVALDGKARVGPGPLDFVEPNGSFSYTVPSAVGYVPTLAAGTVQVSGNDVSILVQFHPPSYPVTVRESGLPAGTNWSMDLAGRTLWSPGASLLFSEENGSYPFASGSVPGFVATPGHGNLSVSGSPVSLVVTYSPFPVSATSSLWLYLDLTLVLAVMVAVFVLVGRRQKPRRGTDSTKRRPAT